MIDSGFSIILVLQGNSVIKPEKLTEANTGIDM